MKSIFKIARLFFWLSIAGVILSAASSMIPFFFGRTEIFSASGQVAAAFASVFGLGLAAFALYSFSWIESDERIRTHKVWQSIQEIKSSLKYAGTVYSQIVRDGTKDPTASHLPHLFQHLIEGLIKNLDQSINPELLVWLTEESDKLKLENPNKRPDSALVHLRMELAVMAGKNFKDTSILNKFLDEYYNPLRDFLNTKSINDVMRWVCENQSKAK